MPLHCTWRTPRTLAYGCVSAVVLWQLAVAGSDAPNPSIANPYLVLIRDPVVHRELAVTDQQRQAIRQMTDELDGPVLALRSQSPEKGGPELGRLIANAKATMQGILSASQQERLDQIILRVQGMRALVGSDVAGKLALSDDQLRQIHNVIAAIDTKFAAVRKQAQDGESAGWFEEQVTRLRQQEQEDVLAVLSDTQNKRLVQLVGRDFDRSRLGQVAFKAPELSTAGTWINSGPLKIADLGGSVIALHFWTFG